MKCDTKDLSEIVCSLDRVANSITPLGSCPTEDDNGGYVSSLTESMMSVSAGCRSIADAINNLADAVREACDRRGG